jgi:hypothetical protein
MLEPTCGLNTPRQRPSAENGLRISCNRRFDTRAGLRAVDHSHAASTLSWGVARSSWRGAPTAFIHERAGVAAGTRHAHRASAKPSSDLPISNRLRPSSTRANNGHRNVSETSPRRERGRLGGPESWIDLKQSGTDEVAR